MISIPRCGIRRSKPIATEAHWRLETMSRGCSAPLMNRPINSPDLGRKSTESEQRRGDVVARLKERRDRLSWTSAAVRCRLRVHKLRPGVAGRPDAAQTALAQRGQAFWCWAQVPDPHSTIPNVCVGAYGRCDRVLATSSDALTLQASPPSFRNDNYVTIE